MSVIYKDQGEVVYKSIFLGPR